MRKKPQIPMGLLLIVLGLGSSQALGAIHLNCGAQSLVIRAQESVEDGDSSEPKSLRKKILAPKILATDVRLTRLPGQRLFNVIATQDQRPLGQLSVEGTVLHPVLHLQKEGSSVSCSSPRDVSPLFNLLIDRPETLEVMRRWNDWVSRRKAPCSRTIESYARFHPDAKKIAIVFHGVFSNPRRMKGIVDLLAEQGYNVLAPRLQGHFNIDLLDLDRVSYADWIQDSSEVFQIAQAFSGKVTLAGFSLGGILSSRLAIQNRQAVEKVVLISPAWRVRADISMGTIIGSTFGISLNDLRDEPIACRVAKGYGSSVAGRQVEQFTFDTERNFGGDMPRLIPSAFRLRVPHLILSTPQDEAVQASALVTICASNTGYCRLAEVPGRKHVNILKDLAALAFPIAPKVNNEQKKAMREMIVDFLKTP